MIGTVRTLEPQTAATDELRRGIADFLSLENSDATDVRLYHRVLAAVHCICDSISECEDAGMARDEILALLDPVRRIHARSPFVHRLQTWPRGYPGDFETIEYLMEGSNRAVGPLPRACEGYALSRSIAQQHRNKVQHQAARILRTLLANPRRTRIASMACGSCPDLRLIGDQLPMLAGEVVLNDLDGDALAFCRAALPAGSEAWRFERGDAITFARRLPHASFDLIVAGGLFDYLPERSAILLIRLALRALAPGGTFFFTNIAAGNPYRTLIEYFGDWMLIERSEDTIRSMCITAGAAPDALVLRRDETGLALLIEVETR